MYEDDNDGTPYGRGGDHCPWCAADWKQPHREGCWTLDPNYDPTEEVRRAMLPDMPAELRRRVAAGEEVWDTGMMQDDFEALGFQAPFIVVRRKSDGVKGTLMFTHRPRYYFGWEAHA